MHTIEASRLRLSALQPLLTQVLRSPGKMLRLTREFLRPHGLLFLVLPLPCVENSRYLDNDMLVALLASVGFVVVAQKRKLPDGKLAYYLCRATPPPERSDHLEFHAKRNIREGGNRNVRELLL